MSHWPRKNRLHFGADHRVDTKSHLELSQNEKDSVAVWSLLSLREQRSSSEPDSEC